MHIITEEGENDRRNIAFVLEEGDTEALKRKIVQLYDENKRYKNFINHSHSRNKSDAGQSQYLKSQISLLEKKLYEYQVEINNLRNQSSPDYNILYEQGEKLRN